MDLYDPHVVRSLLRRCGGTPRNSLSQNFVVDSAVIEALITALQPTLHEEVFEIGAGVGTLTRELATQARRVVAVELDEVCVRACAITLRHVPNARVVQMDALNADPGELGVKSPFSVVGNIPYGITGPLLQRVLTLPMLPSRLVLLVQREVAARLVAPSGAWSLATVLVGLRAQVERIVDVPPEAFMPRPAVHSSIVRLVPRPVVSEQEIAAVVSVARVAFQSRRKILKHGITRALHGDEQAAVRTLAMAGIDPGRRPGTLSLEEWRAVAAAAEESAWAWTR